MATKVSTTKKTVKSNVGIEAPWTEFGKLLVNIFEHDEEVDIIVDPKEKEGKYNIGIKSCNSSKLAGIKKLIGTERSYGNVTAYIEYIDDSKNKITLGDFEAALKDTGYLVKTVHVDSEMMKADYPIVAKDIIQFYNDNLNDIYGNINLTVEDAILMVIDKSALPLNMFVSTANGTEDEE